MQIFLLSVTVVLSIVLYRMLSSNRATYPFIKTTRTSRSDDGAEYTTSEAEQGLITIDQDVVIVEGQEYSLTAKKDGQAEAYLNIANGKLVSVNIRLENGEKLYFIDPGHSLFLSYQQSLTDTNAHHIFSF